MENNEFHYVIDAFKDEPPIKDKLKHYGTEYLHNGLHTTATIKEKSIALQFCGWEIVLLDNGQYFINDTSGG